MSEAARKFNAYRTVYGPNRTARNEMVHAVLVSDYDALLARCETAEARLALARHALTEIRLRLHAVGRRPEECYEMSLIDDVLAQEPTR